MKQIKVRAGQTWRGRVAKDVVLDILAVDKKTNTVHASSNLDNIVHDYKLDTFNTWYAFEVRPLYEIAKDIDRHWDHVWFGAVPYLEAMRRLDGINGTYGLDSATSIVQYFLGNAAQFKGPHAKRLKIELQTLCEMAD